MSSRRSNRLHPADAPGSLKAAPLDENEIADDIDERDAHYHELSPFPEKWEHQDFGGRSYEKLRKAVKNADLFNVSSLLIPPQLLLSLVYQRDPINELKYLDPDSFNEADYDLEKTRRDTMARIRSPKLRRKSVAPGTGRKNTNF